MSSKAQATALHSPTSLEAEIENLKNKLREQQTESKRVLEDTINQARAKIHEVLQRCETLETEKNKMLTALQEKDNQIRFFSAEIGKLEAQLSTINKEKDRRTFIDTNTLRIPLIFNDENSQYDGVLKQMNEVGAKQLIQFYETVPGMVAQGTPFVLYLCNVASRFHEDMNKEKRDNVAGLAKMVKNIAIRFCLNPKAMTSLTDDAIHYQFLYDGTKLLDIAENHHYLESIVKDIRGFKPLPVKLI